MVLYKSVHKEHYDVKPVYEKGRYILVVSWGCPSERYPLNGLFQWDQARALKEAGEEVVFLALDMRSVRRWRRWGIHSFDREGISVYEFNFPYGPFSPRVKYRIQQQGFDKALNRISLRFGKPLCVHFHGVMEAVSGMMSCMDAGIPYMITEHITPVEEGEEVHRAMTEAYAHADRIICVSNRLAADIKKAYGADTDAVIPNIVDLKLFEYNGEKPKRKQGFRFISAAGLNAGKGMDVLLKAFAEVVGSGSDLPYMTIMGDGDQMESLVKLRDELGLKDCVEFTGSYVRPEFADRLKQSDCFVLASRSETFGIVYIEAMAAGVPVIATGCGGPEDFVDETNGLIVPVDDVSALADAMITMMGTADNYDHRYISDSCRQRFSAAIIGQMVSREIHHVAR